MPFTPAHVAAVLPLRGRGGTGLPLAALAAGSMSPDLPMYLPNRAAGAMAHTHTLVGVLTWDLLIGLAFWLTWRAVTPALHDLAPDWARERWRPAGWTDHRAWTLGVAVVLGSATHVLWDEFTHRGRWGTSHVPVLAAIHDTPFGPFAGAQLAQWLSGVVGLTILALVGLRQPRVTAGPRRLPALAGVTPILVVAGMATGLALRFTRPDVVRFGLHSGAVEAAVAGTAGGVVALGICVLLHRLVVRRPPMAAESPG